MSRKPSPSKSSSATPDPMVSIRYFLGVGEARCTNSMPDLRATSSNVTQESTQPRAARGSPNAAINIRESLFACTLEWPPEGFRLYARTRRGRSVSWTLIFGVLCSAALLPHQTAEDTLSSARAALGKQDWNGAEPIVLGVLKKTPNHPEALSLLGRVRVGQRRPADAVPVLQRALEL